MGQLSSKLRSTSDNGLTFWCPGCDGPHRIGIGEGAGPRWGWNGDVERATFTPSVLVRGVGMTAEGQAQADAWFAAHCPQPVPKFDNRPTVCHSFVTDGRIQFLGDCTHALAGQTVDLPDWPRSED